MSIQLGQLISISVEGNNFLSIDGTDAVFVVGVPCNWRIELADPDSPDGPYTIMYCGSAPPPGQVLPCLSLDPNARPDDTANVVITPVQTPPHPCQTFSLQETDTRYVTPNVVPNKSLLLSLSPAPRPNLQPG